MLLAALERVGGVDSRHAEGDDALSEKPIGVRRGGEGGDAGGEDMRVWLEVLVRYTRNTTGLASVTGGEDWQYQSTVLQAYTSAAFSA